MDKRHKINADGRDTNSQGQTKETHGFIEYNNLRREDRLLFSHSGLDRFIGIAGRILSKRLGPIETHKLDQPYFKNESLEIIEGLIAEILNLIGVHSNDRFGEETKAQNQFFKKPGERDTFPIHLFVARWEAAKHKLSRNAANAKKIAANSETAPVYSKKSFKGIAEAKKLKYCPSNLTETETRAVGVLYMINLVWAVIRERVVTSKMDVTQASAIAQVLQTAFCLHTLLDESDQMVSHSEGGKTGNKKIRFSEAAEIIRELVHFDPDIPTNILSDRAQSRIAEDGIGAIPKHRWISDQIRLVKKSLRKN